MCSGRCPAWRDRRRASRRCPMPGSSHAHQPLVHLRCPWSSPAPQLNHRPLRRLDSLIGRRAAWPAMWRRSSTHLQMDPIRHHRRQAAAPPEHLLLGRTHKRRHHIQQHCLGHIHTNPGLRQQRLLAHSQMQFAHSHTHPAHNRSSQAHHIRSCKHLGHSHSHIHPERSCPNLLQHLLPGSTHRLCPFCSFCLSCLFCQRLASRVQAPPSLISYPSCSSSQAPAQEQAVETGTANSSYPFCSSCPCHLRHRVSHLSLLSCKALPHPWVRTASPRTLHGSTFRAFELPWSRFCHHQ
mmetsp:Transcript_11047/g.25278  ORF Transcript_11047/g.25278 Transcript_11047/m.25278 type:complete len:295 (-) Transcript_11047:441-1325(-)